MDQSTKFNTPAVSIGNQVKDGDEFVLIKRSRGSEQPQVWSSGDEDQTRSLYRLASAQIAGLETTS